MQIIVPLLRVLVLMHEQHILHRDIKPENIFLTGKHKLKLGDLGLAIRSNEELPFTRSGTLDYMAPEVMSLMLNMPSCWSRFMQLSSCLTLLA